MSSHLTEERIRDFVLGVHEELQIGEIKQHVTECRACAKALAHEAALEHALWEVRQHIVICPGCGKTYQDVAEPLRCDGCGVAFRAGSFRVLDVLVRTEHSRLYLAEDQEGNVVALKELVFAQVPDAQTLEAFEREARLLRQLDHPRIPNFVDSFQEGEGVGVRLYLAQEFVEGTSLLQKLDDHRFTEEEVIDIGRQILDILVYLQDLSPPIFHRDVKPANLIIKPDGAVVLVDFGAARDVGATQGGTAVGTFGYMPTEQLAGIVNTTTDLFALGATLVHLLCRRSPWEILGQEPIGKRVSVSPEFRAYLERLTAAEPAERYPSAKRARAALDAKSEAKPQATSRRLKRGLFLGGMIAAGSAVGFASLASMSLVPTPELFETVSWLRVSGAANEGPFSGLDSLFLVCAIIGGVLFLVRMAMQLFGGHSADGDLHADGDLDIGDLDHGDVDHVDFDAAEVDHGHFVADVKLLTLQGIMAFLVMFGLVGLALSRQSGFGGFFSILGAMLVGVATMWAIAKIFSLATKLQSSGTVDNTAAIGQEGKVYLSIPADGVGKIHLSVQSRFREYEAVSHSEVPIETGERVRVVAVKDGRIMVVEQIATAKRKGD